MDISLKSNNVKISFCKILMTKISLIFKTLAISDSVN